MDYLLLFTTHMPAILLVEDPGGRAAVEDYSAVGVSKRLVEARAQNTW